MQTQQIILFHLIRFEIKNWLKKRYIFLSFQNLFGQNTISATFQNFLPPLQAYKALYNSHSSKFHLNKKHLGSLPTLKQQKNQSKHLIQIYLLNNILSVKCRHNNSSLNKYSIFFFNHKNHKKITVETQNNNERKKNDWIFKRYIH